MKFEGTCCTCRYCMHDYSTGTEDCTKCDDLTEEQFEKHFVNEEEGCPCYQIMEVWM